MSTVSSFPFPCPIVNELHTLIEIWKECRDAEKKMFHRENEQSAFDGMMPHPVNVSKAVERKMEKICQMFSEIYNELQDRLNAAQTVLLASREKLEAHEKKVLVILENHENSEPPLNLAVDLASRLISLYLKYKSKPSVQYADPLYGSAQIWRTYDDENVYAIIGYLIGMRDSTIYKDDITDEKVREIAEGLCHRLENCIVYIDKRLAGLRSSDVYRLSCTLTKMVNDSYLFLVVKDKDSTWFDYSDDSDDSDDEV